MSVSPFLESAVPLPAPLEDRWIWATVTQSSPLRIKIDGDQNPLPITPPDMFGAVTRAVGQRVYCQMLNRTLVVMGPAVYPAPPVEVPPGALLDFAGGTVPSGFLLCDGLAVSRTTYSALFSAIGTTWGVGDNSTTFNLPDFRGRVAAGRDSAQTEFATLGQTGGTKKQANMVAKILINSSLLRYLLGGAIPAWTPGIQASLAANAGSGSFTGGVDVEAVAAAGNLQPYGVVNKIIKF